MTQAASPDSSSAAPADLESLTDWLAGWGAEVARVDQDTARSRFAADVIGFGTYADVVVGLDRLVEGQWRNVWGTIRDFTFDTAGAHVLVSPDRLQAVIVAPWTSTGIAEDGTPFERPGRATIVVRRAAVGEPWIGQHTHFSLGRGVPQQSFG